MVESKYQKTLMDKIRDLYPGCIITKNDPNYIQGFPDWTIFYKDKWVVLEAKAYADAPHRPNQDYYVDELNKMSYSSFAFPENEEEVLKRISDVFNK